ncbi:triose-phosphate isomerase [Bacteroidales bacterium OttesenSCG-928-I21]|nr:triose-phosphate isomerase [Bacteroidales bacterium OttesenSCG-928-I21]
MRRKIAAGNWKMNTVLNEGLSLAEKLNTLLDGIELDNSKRVIIAVPYTHIEPIIKVVDSQKIAVAAQNCSQFDNGAYTGEISALMLKEIGVQYVIIGHSERREYFGDSNEVVSQKLAQCYKNALSPILCCGESLGEREQEKHFEVVGNQIKAALLNVDKFNIQRTIIAYEPIWAIGTGKTASPEQAQEMHAHIRKVVSELYNEEIANDISILYGGSVNAANSANLFANKDIDGGLVGGASLKANDFIQIIESL